MTSFKFAIVLAAAAVAATLLTGCASGPSSDEVTAHKLETAVVDAVPVANDAYIGYATDGSPTRHTLLIRLYLSDTPAPAQLLALADTTLKTLWLDAPFHPYSILFEASIEPKPQKAKNSDFENIDLTGLDTQMAAGYVGIEGMAFSLSDQELAARYGARPKEK